MDVQESLARLKEPIELLADAYKTLRELELAYWAEQAESRRRLQGIQEQIRDVEETIRQLTPGGDGGEKGGT